MEGVEGTVAAERLIETEVSRLVTERPPLDLLQVALHPAEMPGATPSTAWTARKCSSNVRPAPAKSVGTERAATASPTAARPRRPGRVHSGEWSPGAR